MGSEGLELLPLGTDDVDHRTRVSAPSLERDMDTVLSTRGTGRRVGFWDREVTVVGLGFSLPEADFCKVGFLGLVAEIGVKVFAAGLVAPPPTPWSLRRRADEADINLVQLVV